METKPAVKSLEMWVALFTFLSMLVEAVRENPQVAGVISPIWLSMIGIVLLTGLRYFKTKQALSGIFKTPTPPKADPWAHLDIGKGKPKFQSDDVYTPSQSKPPPASEVNIKDF